MISRRRFLKFLAAGSGAGVGIGLYTWQWEPHWLEIVERPLPVEQLPDRLIGARLVQLSDLHIGPRVEDSYLIETFDQVKSLSPDIVVYTGDFISHEQRWYEHTGRMFGNLPRGRLATFGILGNHEYGAGWANAAVAEGVAELATSAGVRILRNELATIEELQIVGLDDLWAGRFKPQQVLPRMDTKKAAIVFSHNPDTADQPGWGTYRGWILAGHTHGGQCKPPFLPPPLLPVKNRRYQAGEYELAGGRRMYINRGVGHLLQVRFNVRPEVTAFHLDRA